MLIDLCNSLISGQLGNWEFVGGGRKRTMRRLGWEQQGEGGSCRKVSCKGYGKDERGLGGEL